MDIQKIKGIIFDYGGTIDSNGEHWAEVLWKAYEEAKVPVAKDAFREAYVYGERTLATQPLVYPEHLFLDVLRIKTRLQIDWLAENGYLAGEGARQGCSGSTAGSNKRIGDVSLQTRQCYAETVARICHDFVVRTLAVSRPLIARLARRYPLVLVSNFYGNIEAVLKGYELSGYFQAIVESAVVGVRKPDPAIFRLGVERLRLPANEVAVIGDSYKKDMVPASRAGCATIWLKKSGWEPFVGNETADIVITDFKELETVFNL